MAKNDEIKLFWLEPTKQAERYLRRYAGVPDGKPLCPGRYRYHNARVTLSVNHVIFREDGKTIAALPELPKSDERWPVKCDHCDYEFGTNDPYQHGQNLLYQRGDTGALVAIEDAPLGAMWDAWWCGKSNRGLDGIHLMLKTPGGDWTVDGRCSNCKAIDTVHQCWPRTGNPKDPQGNPPLDVPSNGGCKVGAGSIGIGSAEHRNYYHGFLNKGYLRTKRQ